MRTLMFFVVLSLFGGCAAEQDHVMIGLSIKNEMDRHVVSSQIDFIPESETHVFGSINALIGRRTNHGFPVNAQPTVMKVTYFVAVEPGGTLRDRTLHGEREEMVHSVELFEPRRNRGNYPEYHLIIRPDGTIEQVMDINEDGANQQVE